jgi:hypothetical protein
VELVFFVNRRMSRAVRGVLDADSGKVPACAMRPGVGLNEREGQEGNK